MAREIVDVALAKWREDAAQGKVEASPENVGASQTDAPVNPLATTEAVAESRRVAADKGWDVPEFLWTRYGAEALAIYEIHRTRPDPVPEVEGFPYLGSQLRYEMRNGMVMRLEDFYLRRCALYATCKDHGLAVAEALARVWSEEMNLGLEVVTAELERLKDEFKKRDAWRKPLT
jgi:glycerol-3-phosphate dehydrogenase